eukprot:TRINITY_DN11556_c0_g1_i1.p1 TRINITY_DN11556_c0_g1~~TRINITY_DN11556_c0_g1_i1.p1  ORF type:complete len:342 (+),score=62.52 TRINITY_DN11556_c0_g1_i1:149-1174(+)
MVEYVMQMSGNEVEIVAKRGAAKSPSLCLSFSSDSETPENGFDNVSSAATTTPSEEGSTHGEFSSAAAGEGLADDSFDSEAEEDDAFGMKTPSKSARRRMRRRRQRDAIVATIRSREAEMSQTAKQMPWHCAGSPPAPICTSPLASTPMSFASTMIPSTPASSSDAMSFPASPACGHGVLSALGMLSPCAAATPSFVVPPSPACCSTPSSILSATHTGDLKVMGTSPCNGTIIRGDAACRSPVNLFSAPQQLQQVPYVVQQTHVYPPAAVCPPLPHCAPAPPVVPGVAIPANTLVAAQPQVMPDPIASTLNMMMGYDISRDTRENMAARLQAAMFSEVYED